MRTPNRSHLTAIVVSLLAGCVASGGSPATPADLAANATTPHATTQGSTNITTPTTPPTPASAPSFYALAIVTPATSANESATITVATATSSTDPNATSPRPLHVAALAVGWDVTRLDLGTDTATSLYNALRAFNDTLAASSITFRGANESTSWTVPMRAINSTGNMDAPVAIIIFSPDTGRLVALGLDGQTIAAWTDNVVNGEIVGHSWARVRNAVLDLTT